MAIKVHGALFSTCTARVLICLCEKGLDYELLPIDMVAGANKEQPFRSLNVRAPLKSFPFFLVAESYFLSWVTYYISCCCYVFRKYFQKDNKIEFFTLLLQFHFQPFGEIPAFEDGEVCLFGKFFKSKTLP